MYTHEKCVNYAIGDVRIVNMQWLIYPQFARDIQRTFLGGNEVCFLPMQMGITPLGLTMNSSAL